MKILSAIGAGLKAGVTTPFKWGWKGSRPVLNILAIALNDTVNTRFKVYKSSLDSETGAVVGGMSLILSCASLIFTMCKLCAAGVLSTGAAWGVGILALPVALPTGFLLLSAGLGSIGFAAGVACAPYKAIQGYNDYLNPPQSQAVVPAASKPVSKPARKQTPAASSGDLIDGTVNQIQKLPENERQAVATQLKKRLTAEFGAAVEPEDLTADISTQETKPKIRLKKGPS